MNNKILSSVLYNVFRKAFFAILLFQSISSLPLNSTVSYDKFLESITQSNCEFPEGIVLPFKQSNITFKYLGSEFLKICRDPVVTKRSKEAVTLCNDIYDNLRNITCHIDTNIKLPEIKIEFSDNVCQDVINLQLQHALDDKSFLKHLATDKFICDLMCEDDFLPACKVLFWSYQLKKRIEDAHPVQATENTNQQENDNQDDERTDLKQEANTDQSLVNEVEIPKIDDVDKTTLIQTERKDGIPQKQEVKNDLPQEPLIDIESNIKLESNGSQDSISNLNEQNQAPQEEKSLIESVSHNEQLPNDQLPANIKQPNDKEKEVQMKNETPKLLEHTETINQIIPKNKPAIEKTETLPQGINKTELKKDVATTKANLAETQKEIDKVKATDNTSENKTTIKPKLVNKEVNNELNKLQKTVSTATTKTTLAKEPVKVSLKPEVVPAKMDETMGNPSFPTVKEDLSSFTTVADLEKMEEDNGIPEPSEKEPQNYNDDDDGFFESSKNRKTEETEKIEKPVVAENELPKYDVFPPRNAFGREPDGIQVIPPFPEQEDSHFFFYFLSMVFILMAGYLLFHNKQKIIALIVEGRHERRRRSHGVGYRKLETK